MRASSDREGDRTRTRLHNTPVHPPRAQSIFADASMLYSAASGCEGAGTAEEKGETDDRACAEVLADDDDASRGHDTSWEEECRSGIGGEGGQEMNKRRKGKSDWQRMMRDKGKRRECAFLLQCSSAVRCAPRRSRWASLGCVETLQSDLFCSKAYPSRPLFCVEHQQRAIVLVVTDAPTLICREHASGTNAANRGREVLARSRCGLTKGGRRVRVLSNPCRGSGRHEHT